MCHLPNPFRCPSPKISGAYAPPFAGLISTESHRTPILRRLIHSLKYDNMPHLAQPLGIRMATALQHYDWELDLVISVPLHPHRQREKRV
ncbi:MAG UNVERIFIED_CONTAM: hypothetical protein LVT10_03765 [Anaerolineae bacterium]|jgi:predicted amidophosphoribosyltransferase